MAWVPAAVAIKDAAKGLVELEHVVLCIDYSSTCGRTSWLAKLQQPITLWPLLVLVSSFAA